MESLVQSHLDLLARNKLSDINYASDACGATIVRTIDSTGVPGNDPALMLSDTVVPGHAWSFLELPASILIKLCLPVRISKISLEHIVGYFPEMHLTEAAPADFEIWVSNKSNSFDHSFCQVLLYLLYLIFFALLHSIFSVIFFPGPF